MTEQDPLPEGSLLSHLLELRDRLLKAMLAIIVCAIPCIAFSNRIFEFVSEPLIAKLPVGATMIATNVVAPFMAPIKLALLAGLFFAMPVVLYQIWAFVAPGLYKQEKRFAIPLLISSVVLFYGGVAFAYYVVFPVIFAFFTTTGPANVTMMTDMNEYLDFVLMLFFSFGIAFEIPVATVLLVLTGLLRLQTLTENRGYVLIGIFVVAAFITPPDAISQCIMAVPMYLLYEGGIVMARVMNKAKLQSKTEEEAAGH